MRYWESEGWNDAWLKRQRKARGFFEAWQIGGYADYCRGYRKGQADLKAAAGGNQHLNQCR